MVFNVTEREYRIICLLDVLSPEKRNYGFLGAKLDISKPTLQKSIESLKAKEIIRVGESFKGEKHFFLKNELRSKELKQHLSEVFLYK